MVSAWAEAIAGKPVIVIAPAATASFSSRRRDKAPCLVMGASSLSQFSSVLCGSSQTLRRYAPHHLGSQVERHAADCAADELARDAAYCPVSDDGSNLAKTQ